ncbi:hypothetical protein Tco_0899784 [Tanacetum coccineum]
MSDSEHSTITYLTELEYSDMGSPGVDGPPSPDYVPGPEAPHLPIYIPYVPEPEYPEFMPPEDHVFPAEEQPLPAVVSPTADSPGYIPESDPEGDPEEEDEEDPEEDPAYYPADIGDDDEEDEEEEHLAFADSTVVALPAVDRTDSIFFISYSPFPQTPSPPPPQIYFLNLLGHTSIEDSRELFTSSEEASSCFLLPLFTRSGRLQRPLMLLDNPGCPDNLGAPTTLEGVNQRVIELSSTVDEEDEIIYSQLDDARYDRALLRARVNMLESDRPFHGRTAVLMEEEARLSRAAWAQSMDACDQTHSEGILLRTTVMTQQSEIVELRAADQRRQTVISELLKADYRRQRQLVETLKIVKSLKAQMTELQRQQGPAKDPAEPELPEEAGSST